MAQSWQSEDGLIKINNIPDYVDTDSYEFLTKVRKKYRSKDMDVPEPYKIDIEQIGSGVYQNMIPSTGGVLKDYAQALLNPIDTVANLLQVTRGAVHTFMPDKVFESGVLTKDPEAIEKAKIMGNYYKTNYGSIEKAKETFAADPAAVLADASVFLRLGSAGMKKMGDVPGAGVTSKVLEQASIYTDPLTAVGGVLGVANKVGATPAAKGVKKLTGFLTGLGTRPFEEAFKAGKQYGKTQKGSAGRQRADFWKYYSGAKNPLTIVDELRKGFKILNSSKNKKYSEAVEKLKSNETIPSYDKLGKALNSVYAEVIDPASDFTVSSTVAKTLEDTQKIIDEFAANPKVQNLYGFELLRKRLQSDIKNKISYDTQAGKQQARAIDKVLESIKQTVIEAEPSYGKTITEYAEASSKLDDFAATLGELSPANKAQALKKFLNGFTNPGSDSGVIAGLIEEASIVSGRNIEAMLSGVLLTNSTIKNLSGRGLVGLGGIGQVVDLGATQLLGMPASQPRMGGRVAYGSGRIKGAIEGATPAPVTRGLFNVGVQPTRAGITDPAPTTEEELRQLLINRQLNR